MPLKPVHDIEVAPSSVASSVTPPPSAPVDDLANIYEIFGPDYADLFDSTASSPELLVEETPLP